MCNSLQPCGLLPTRLLCPWDSPGKDTRVGFHSLLQGIFPTQGSNLCLLHCRWILYCLSPQGSSTREDSLQKPDGPRKGKLRFALTMSGLYLNWELGSGLKLGCLDYNAILQLDLCCPQLRKWPKGQGRVDLADGFVSCFLSRSQLLNSIRDAVSGSPPLWSEAGPQAAPGAHRGF